MFLPMEDKAAFQSLGYIYINDMATGKNQRLTKQTSSFETHPQFSRDGKWLVYATWNDSNLSSIKMTSANGKKTKNLVSAKGHYVEPHAFTRQ